MRLDGGAMFGNAPRALWERWARPDHRHMIRIPAQSLLIRTKDHAVLFETGPGAYLPPEMKARFQMDQDRHLLLEGLAGQGLDHDNITHVILSHLHFDHSGGLLSSWQANREPGLLFPNARVVTGRQNFERACAPHPRDRASFIPELAGLLEKSGRLDLMDDGDRMDLGPLEIRFQASQGHTPGMLISWIRAGSQTLVFTGDLIPGRAWVNPAITMGYDRFPEQLIDEKQDLLEQALSADALLVYPHDIGVSRLGRDEATGRIRIMDDQEALDLRV